MPQAINELDVDFEARIQEIKRLISSSNDAERRTALEDQLRELELARIQDEQDQQQPVEFLPAARRKSFRPVSAKPRMSALTPLAEDAEVVSSSFHGLEAHRLDDGGLSLIADVFSSSFDENYGPTNVIANDSRTLWVSNGMFPQFIRLLLREPKRVAAIEVTCRHIEKMKLRISQTRSAAVSRMAVSGELDVSAADSGKLNTHRFTLTPRHGAESKEADDMENAEPIVEAIQIDVESGYSDFVCIYSVRLRLSEDTTN